jgi:polysaccharide biosynthesis/export protein
MKNLLITCLGAMLLLAGCKHPESGFVSKMKFTDHDAGFVEVGETNRVSAAALRPPDEHFTLGPGDKLEIEIVGQPTTLANTAVGPDGKIYFYLLPGLDVWGLSLTQTQQLLEQGLAKYLSNPVIAVNLREVASKHVWVVGRLNKPGIYPMTGPMTLLEAIAQAGGTARSSSPTSSQDLADLRHSFVMRQGQLLPVDFYRLLREGDTSQNVRLQSDDFVYVPSALDQEVYVLGAVNAPRAIPYLEGMTVISAVAGTEGSVKQDWLDITANYNLRRDAYLSHVAIVRGTLSQPKIAVVDFRAIMTGKAPNIPLEPGDIVYVPNSPYRFLKSYVNLIVNSFVSTVAANEGIHAGGGTTVGVAVPVTGQ